MQAENRKPEAFLDTYFDKVFYINLKKDKDRDSHVKDQFNKYNIRNVERFEACVIEKKPERTVYRNFIRNEDKYVLGQLSCKESHLSVISLARERSYSTVLIFEDDIEFLQDPNVLLQLNLDRIGSWDMLYFGGLVEPQFRNQIVCTHAYALRSTVFDDILEMADRSGMEIDNFYAKILQQMSYNFNASGKYDIRMVLPFNQIIQKKDFPSNIQ